MNELRKGIFLDRDGVINKLLVGEPPDSYLHRWDQFEFCDRALDALLHAYLYMDYELFVVSNQSGISRWPERMPYGNIKHIMNKMFREIDEYVREDILCNHAIVGYPRVAIPDDYSLYKPPSVEEQHVLTDVIMCPHLPDFGCCCRKPKPGMIYFLAFRWGIDLSKSWMIGDSTSDMKAGWNAGIRHLIHVGDDHPEFDGDVEAWRYYQWNTSFGVPKRDLYDAIQFIDNFDKLKNRGGKSG